MTYIVHFVVTLFFLICTLELSFAQGDLSATLQGQAGGAKLTVGTIQVPNNLATKTGSINALIETGNTNILANPSFEHSASDTAWTVGGTAGLVGDSQTVVIHGKKSYFFTTSSQTINLSQTSTLYQAQFADGVQGLASIRVKTDHTGTCSVCSINNSTVSTTNCVTVQANNKWGLYKVPFILGATNNGISLACTSGSGTTYVDDAFVGAVDLQASVDQSRVAGEAYFAGTSSCTWSRTSTTVGAFTATAACPGPTIVTSTMGQWQTTDSDLPRVTINNLPAGTYKAKFYLNMSTSGGNVSGIAINDGTTTCEAVQSNNSNSTDVGQVVECTFSYNTAGNRTYEVYGASSVGSLAITNSRNASPRISTKFILEYFGSGSVYTSANADTDWASCGHTPSDFTGFGTVTNIETQCKREGSDLLMRGKFTTGTPTGSEARLNLRLGGTALVSAPTSVIPSIQLAGQAVQNINSTTYFGNSVLIEPSTSYVTFGVQTSTLNSITKQTGANAFATSQPVSIFARIPISGWTNSNIIIGQFNGLQQCTDTLACTDTFSAKIAADGTVTAENVDWINGNCSNSTSAVCSFNSGVFTVSPNCWTESNGGSNLYVNLSGYASTSSVTLIKQDLASVAFNHATTLFCQKQGADYVGKTAVAVASDQNIATPGVTKVKACYYAFGGASATLASPTECTTGTCVEVVDTCGAGSPPAFAATGLYQSMSFANGTFANSSPVNCSCVAYDTTTGDARACLHYFRTAADTWSSNSSGGYTTSVTVASSAGVAQNGYVQIKCEGQAP